MTPHVSDTHLAVRGAAEHLARRRLVDQPLGSALQDDELALARAAALLAGPAAQKLAGGGTAGCSYAFQQAVATGGPDRIPEAWDAACRFVADHWFEITRDVQRMLLPPRLP